MDECQGHNNKAKVARIIMKISHRNHYFKEELRHNLILNLKLIKVKQEKLIRRKRKPKRVNQVLNYGENATNLPLLIISKRTCHKKLS